MDEAAAAGRLEPSRSVVVYDAQSGEIVQVHHFAAMAGAELPPGADLQQAALQAASKRHRRDTSELAAIDVEPGELRPATAYRVSVSRRTLEADESS